MISASRIARRFSRALTGAILLAACAAPGCGKTNTYSYVDVHVVIDPTIPDKDLMSMVVSCEVQVTGADHAQGVTLPRCAGLTTHDLGTFEWSSTASGTVQFTVELYALNRVLFATGTTEEVTLVPNTQTKASVIVRAVATDGGVPDAGGNGGSAGTAGAAGTAGTSGTAGMTGTAGVTGTAGMTGTAGVSGTAGTSGSAGAGGTSGSAGAGGRSGTAGSSGTAGTSGTAGRSGGAGSTGTAGSAGTAGAGGVNGGGGAGTSGSAGSAGAAGGAGGA